MTLLLVAVFMTPLMLNLVATRRFTNLEKRRGASLLASVLWSAASTAAAIGLLVVSIPLWFIPPLIQDKGRNEPQMDGDDQQPNRSGSLRCRPQNAGHQTGATAFFEVG